MQDDTLSGQVSSVDIATKQNLNDLVEVGEGLLKKPVSRVNLENGRFEASNHETNEEALIRCSCVCVFSLIGSEKTFICMYNIMLTFFL